MKKSNFVWIGILIVILFTITGCNKADHENPLNKYGFQPPVENIYWGMPLNEIEETLSIQDGVDGVIYKYEKPTTTIILPNKIKKFGYTATVYLEVNDAIDIKDFPYKSSSLYCVKLIYADIDGKKLKTNMIKDFEDSGNDWIDPINNNITTWQSKDTISALEPEIFNKLQDYWRVLDERIEGSSLIKTEKDRINIVSLRLGELTSALVSYEGDTAVPINKVCIEVSKQ